MTRHFAKARSQFCTFKIIICAFQLQPYSVAILQKTAKSPADAEWTNDLHLEFWAFVYGEHVGLSKCSIVLLLQMSIINYSSYLQTTLWSNFVAHHLTPTPSLFKCPSFKISDSGNKIQIIAKTTNMSLQQDWHLRFNLNTKIVLFTNWTSDKMSQSRTKPQETRGFLLLSDRYMP